MAQNSNSGKGISRSLVVALAGAAAGYYFYASKDAATHRKAAAKWAGEFKDEVINRAKKLKKIDKKTIAGAVDSAMKAYAGARNLDRKELAQAASELKANWQKMVREMESAGKEAAGSVKRAAKKAKKTVQKRAGKRSAKK